jgi:hypothetical protein
MIITEADGKVIKSRADLDAVVAGKRPGNRILIKSLLNTGGAVPYYPGFVLGSQASHWVTIGSRPKRGGD